MGRPDYLPTHDHFFGYAAKNREVLTPLLPSDASEDVPSSIYPEPSFVDKSVGWMQGTVERRATSIEAEQSLSLVLKIPVSKRETSPHGIRQDRPMSIQDIEFESSDSNGWWDIKIRARSSRWTVQTHLVPTGSAKLYLKTKNQTLSSCKIQEKPTASDAERLFQQLVEDMDRFRLKEVGRKPDGETLAENVGEALQRDEWSAEKRWRNGGCTVLVEYKVSLEELNVEKTIRQMKKRETSGTPLLATFDERFEKYRALLENEDIHLHVFGDDLRRKIQREFTDQADASLDAFS